MLNRSLTSTLDRMMTMNRAFDDAFANGSPNGGRVWMPAMDVVEKSDSYLVSAELPGLDLSQVELSFEQNVLTIRGTKSNGIDARDGEVRVYASERVTGSFERAIRLPEFVDADNISAELKNGVLTVTVPKAQTAQARKIEIRG